MDINMLFSKQAAHETSPSSLCLSEDDGEGKDTTSRPPPVSSQLLLKPSSKAQAARNDHNHHAASRALDRDVVLRRIRDHRSLNHVRSALLSLRSGARHSTMWADPEDAFSSP
ncbi:unnamed protein product [Linum trigynum]|uniref:Uncharacterized protein n=1 Tax=Linum trigynum TaxID=586398 RepID=A0AAV2E3B7_9ROSI